MNDTGHFVDPNESLRSIGESIRDLAYEKLEEECINRFNWSKGSNYKDGYITVDEGGTITVDTPDGDIVVNFDRDAATLIPSLLDTSAVTESGIFDDIPDVLARFEEKGLEQCDNIINSLSRFVGTEKFDISSGTAEMNVPLKRLSSATEHWDGHAAISFSEFFVEPMPDALKNQQNLISELSAAAHSQRTLIVKSAESARNIGIGTRGALIAYPGSVDVWNVVMPIVGAALAVGTVALCPPAGPVAVTMGLLNLANTGADAGEKVTTATTSGKATSVLEIIDSMNDAIKRLDDQIDTETNDMIRGLTTTEQDVTATLRSAPETRRYLLPNRPAIADAAPDLTDFGAPHV